ncbi:MAG TPA: hypothetical protein ENN51_00280 [candidate division WOR-3 bacterium]|uniref:PKD domain-containing protein n=1 Tax=candidate division WOR-3 bacterium TaxID=2052148 RepID=A0A7V0T4C5_UNCW3|nr:hypothetical protein [candidate division WOR-3 bacterium]
MRHAPWLLLLPLLTGCGNTPPEPPLMTGPTRLRPNDTLVLAVWSVDPDGDSLSYRIAWGDGAESDWSRWYSSGDRATFAHAYGDSGVFEAVTRARDHSVESADSDPLIIRVFDYGPNRPTPPRLASDTAVVGANIGAMTSAGHPLGERVSLQVDWGDTLGEWSEFVRAGEHILLRHSYEEPGRHLIRARARDTGDRLSAWSDSTLVTVVMPAPAR